SSVSLPSPATCYCRLSPLHRFLFSTFTLRVFSISSLFFFFNDTATTEIYTLSLHDALPICTRPQFRPLVFLARQRLRVLLGECRSEEHTSELQSLTNLVCRLLLEKKNMLTTDPRRENVHALYNSIAR